MSDNPDELKQSGLDFSVLFAEPSETSFMSKLLPFVTLGVMFLLLIVTYIKK